MKRRSGQVVTGRQAKAVRQCSSVSNQQKLARTNQRDIPAGIWKVTKEGSGREAEWRSNGSIMVKVIDNIVNGVERNAC